jgi:transposase InsO family protein
MKKESASRVKHPPRPPRRGAEGQRARREQELAARWLLVDYVDRAGLQGASIKEAAGRVGVATSTLVAWVRRRELDHLDAKPLGPHAKRCDRATRAEILELLRELGPKVGLPTLEALFPDVAHRELEDLKRRWDRAWARGNMVTVHTLRWTEAGSVWAMDYTTPPRPVDGVFPYVLSVRDLASGRQLAAMPVVAATARTTIDVLTLLFSTHGTPLVIKSDNGSHFTADDVLRALERARVVHLLSPPRMPSYNGSCEAGIGGLMTRAFHEAARHGHPEELTSDDVEAARVAGNATLRPWGPRGPTPDQSWAARCPLGDDRRHALGEHLERLERELRAVRDLGDGELDKRTHASLRREVIRRALVALGSLEIRRRRIRPSLSAQLRADHP